MYVCKYIYIYTHIFIYTHPDRYRYRYRYRSVWVNIAFQRMIKMLFLRENVSKWFKIIVNNRITILILLFFAFRVKCIWIFMLLLSSTLVTKWKFFAHCFSKVIKEVYSWPKVNCALMRIINISFLIVERRRRYNINYRIKELGTLIPIMLWFQYYTKQVGGKRWRGEPMLSKVSSLWWRQGYYWCHFKIPIQGW